MQIILLKLEHRYVIKLTVNITVIQAVQFLWELRHYIYLNFSVVQTYSKFIFLILTKRFSSKLTS